MGRVGGQRERVPHWCEVSTPTAGVRNPRRVHPRARGPLRGDRTRVESVPSPRPEPVLTLHQKGYRFIQIVSIRFKGRGEALRFGAVSVKVRRPGRCLARFKGHCNHVADQGVYHAPCGKNATCLRRSRGRVDWGAIRAGPIRRAIRVQFRDRFAQQHHLRAAGLVGLLVTARVRIPISCGNDFTCD
jgi:hypothetical protein